MSKQTLTPEKTEYFKLSPGSPRYHRIKALAAQKNLPWREVMRNALDLYIELEDRNATIILPSR